MPGHVAAAADLWYHSPMEVLIMSEYANKAVGLFREGGCNCAQAVCAAFCDVTGLDERTAMRVSSSFGGGMGRMREVCGAVSGALMVIGMMLAPEDPTDKPAKTEHYRIIQEYAARFRERNGSIVCRELLGDKAGSGYVPEDRTEEYFKMRPCERMVYDAAALLEQTLAQYVKQA